MLKAKKTVLSATEAYVYVLYSIKLKFIVVLDTLCFFSKF